MSATSPAEPAEEPLWSEEERRAWEPPEEISPSACAQKYRELSRRHEFAAQAQWNKRANRPTLSRIIDLCGQPGFASFWIKKSAQIGVPEAACREFHPLDRACYFPSPGDARVAQ